MFTQQAIDAMLTVDEFWIWNHFRRSRLSVWSMIIVGKSWNCFSFASARILRIQWNWHETMVKNLAPLPTFILHSDARAHTKRNWMGFRDKEHSMNFVCSQMKSYDRRDCVLSHIRRIFTDIHTGSLGVVWRSSTSALANSNTSMLFAILKKKNVFFFAGARSILSCLTIRLSIDFNLRWVNASGVSNTLQFVVVVHHFDAKFTICNWIISTVTSLNWKTLVHISIANGYWRSASGEESSGRIYCFSFSICLSRLFSIWKSIWNASHNERASFHHSFSVTFSYLSVLRIESIINKSIKVSMSKISTFAIRFDLWRTILFQNAKIILRRHHLTNNLIPITSTPTATHRIKNWNIIRSFFYSTWYEKAANALNGNSSHHSLLLRNATRIISFEIWAHDFQMSLNLFQHEPLFIASFAYEKKNKWHMHASGSSLTLFIDSSFQNEQKKRILEKRELFDKNRFHISLPVKWPYIDSRREKRSRKCRQKRTTSKYKR